MEHNQQEVRSCLGYSFVRAYGHLRSHAFPAEGVVGSSFKLRVREIYPPFSPQLIRKLPDRLRPLRDKTVVL